MSNNCILSASAFIDPNYWNNIAIGTATEGGYFAGKFSLNGKTYALILSPKDQGESSSTWGTATTTRALSLNDGLANTQAVNDSGHPLAQWALSLNINGKNDWYIPSRDEAEILFRNFRPKPTSANPNKTGVRTYNQAGDSTNQYGQNANSVPTGTAYTAAVPQQTPLADFQYTGSQYLPLTWMWTSTSYSQSAGMWTTIALTGDQTVLSTSSNIVARVVRKVLIG